MLVLVGISANTKVQQQIAPQPPHNGLLNTDCQPDSPGPETGLDGSLHSSVSHFTYQTLQYAFSPFLVVGGGETTRISQACPSVGLDPFSSSRN